MNFKGLLLGLGAMAVSFSVLAATPKYIFYFIGDGMGMGQAMAGQTYNRVALGNEQPLMMMQFPYGGMIETYSASSTVTDSAAAGTALSTGHKTKNGMLGMDADTVAVTSMAKVLHDAGWGVGLVTTMAPDDATPGAFYAHVPNRNMFYEIGRQAAESGYEFIAGATWRGELDNSGKSRGLHDYIRSKGVDLVTSIEAVDNSKSRRVFLYSESPFTSGDIGYTVDSIPGMLTLPDMTRAAIDHLERVSPDHFFMMVEGGNIDHLGHGNDGGGLAIEVLNFNEAIAQAYNFYLKHPDETVIIVTADHETGGMSVGNRHVGYTSYPQYVPYQAISKDNFSRKVKELLKNQPDMTWDQFKEFTAEKTGLWKQVPIKARQEKKLKEIFDDTFEKRMALADEKTLYSSFNALANEVFNVLNEIQGYGWTTGSHTGNPVPVYAIGDGMEIFGSRMDNTGIAPRLLRLAGLQ